MSTIDVANLTDAESTTTNSANSSDNLNNTTTVDTKFITNGCARGYGMINSDGDIKSSFNLSSITDDGTGAFAGVLSAAMNSADDGSYLASIRTNSSGNFIGIDRVVDQPSQWNARTRNINGNNSPVGFNWSVHGTLA